MTDDIFHHHDGIVNQKADGQGQAQHGHGIDGKIRQAHAEKGGNQGGGNGDSTDQGAADIPQEDEHHQHRKDATQNQVFIDTMHGILDALGVVPDQMHLYAVRQLFL